MDTNTDLDAGEHTLPALQSWNAHHFFHRPLHREESGETEIALNIPSELAAVASVSVMSTTCASTRRLREPPELKFCPLPLAI